MKAITTAKRARPISRLVPIRTPGTREEVLLEAVYRIRELEKQVLDELMEELRKRG
jgi:antitoxin (DNA-binding transcriptional repressor) of toxin-antitoxin stability system